MTTLTRAMEIARMALLFGQVRRATLHPDGEPESDTTHTVMLALLCMEVSRDVGLDPGLAAQFAIVHDLPETYANDTNTAAGLTPEQKTAKEQREAEAIRRLADEQGDSYWFGLLRRYESQAEPEARLVRYLDKVLPKLTHYFNGGTALRAIGMTPADVREKHAAQGADLAAMYPEHEAARRLFVASCDLVEQGIISGVVRLQ